MSIYHRTPEDYIKAWSEMNKEMLEERTPVVLKIPSIKQTKEWVEEQHV